MKTSPKKKSPILAILVTLWLILLFAFIVIAMAQTPDDSIGDEEFFKLDKHFWICSNYVLITKRHAVGAIVVNQNWEPVCVEYTKLATRH